MPLAAPSVSLWIRLFGTACVPLCLRTGLCPICGGMQSLPLMSCMALDMFLSPALPWHISAWTQGGGLGPSVLPAEWRRPEQHQARPCRGQGERSIPCHGALPRPGGC